MLGFVRGRVLWIWELPCRELENAVLGITEVPVGYIIGGTYRLIISREIGAHLLELSAVFVQPADDLFVVVVFELD